MSFQTFCGKDPDDDATYNKVLKEFLPDDAFAVPALNAVLGVGNSASNQSMTDINDIGCVSIETSKVYAGNFAFVELGETGDDIKLLGATTKGSIVAGNGVLTKELPVGLNGYVLTANSGAALGVEWAVSGGGGGGVVAVSGGTNINVSGTIPNPVVNLASPLTSTLNMGNAAITDSAASTGLASQYLTAGTGGKTLWATLPTSVASVSAGTNISITGTATNPIVNLSAPLTSTLNVGSQTLSSSIGAVSIIPFAGTDCNVNVSGTGSLHTIQTSAGGASQPATIVENTNGNANAVHLDLYKNSASPATDDGIAGVSYHANNASGTKVEYARIQADQRDTTAGSENGSVSVLVAQNSATPTEYFRFDGLNGVNKMYKFLETQGNYIQNTSAGQNLTLYQNQNATNIVLNNIGAVGGIQNNCINGQFGVSSSSFQINAANAGTLQSIGNLSLTSFSNVVVPQNSSTQPRMITDIANVNYYPTFVVDNGNSNNITIPPPAIQGERMTLINKGVSPISSWVDITALNLGTGVQTAIRSSNGYVWIAPVSNNYVYIYDETLTTLQGSFYVGASGGGQQVYCMLEDSGYMYIGGDFASINGSATAQVGMTRVSIYSFAQDEFWDSTNNIFGIQYGGVVYDIEAYGGYIYFGGNFNSFSNGNACYNICSITNVSAFNTIYDWCNGGVDNKVYSLLGAGSYLFVGGDFNNVYAGISPVGYSRLATYTGGVGGTWDYTAGNSWNAAINTLQYTNTGQYIFVGGDFSASSPNIPQTYNVYVDYNSPNSSAVDTTLSLANPLQRNSTFYNGNTYISTISNGVYSTSAYQVWVSEGTAQSGYTPSYIGYFNGTINVAYLSYSYFMAKQSVSQTATFTLSSGQFKFNNSVFSSATINIRDVGWDFIGDLTSSPYTWRQTSYNPWGSYS